MKYIKEEYRDGTAMWKFENGITVYSKEWSYCDYAFNVYNADGEFLGGIYPDTDEDSESCVKDLDDGSEPITDGWEDGCGNSCTLDGWGDGLKNYNTGKLTKLGWKNLIEENHKEIEETLIKALKLSYENGNLCNVMLDTDGTAHIFEDVSHGSETYPGEYLYIKGFDSQYSSVIDDYFDDRYIYLECLENELTEKQRAEYKQDIEEYLETNEDDMSESDREEWIGTHAPNAVDKVYEYALNELCQDLDFEEIIASALEEE